MNFGKKMIGIALLLMLATAATACAAQQKEGRIMRGNPDAAVTIVEYTDFQCPYCANGAQTVGALMKKYEGKINLTVKHYPLPFHPAALPAALYFEAIAMQSPEKAWQFYDAVFADPQQLGAGEEALKKLAVSLAVDMQKLEQMVRSPENYKKIAADKREFEQAQFDGVPVFIVNGTVLVGAQSPQKFSEIIDAALK